MYILKQQVVAIFGSQIPGIAQVSEGAVVLFLLEENLRKFITAFGIGVETVVAFHQFEPEIKIPEGSAQPVPPGKHKGQKEINVAPLLSVMFPPGRVTCQYAIIIALVVVTHLQVDIGYVAQKDSNGLTCALYLLVGLKQIGKGGFIILQV